MTASRTVVDTFARGDQPVYGINTGFGSFAEVRIPTRVARRAAGQPASQSCRRRRRSAACSVVRATMALRANVLAKGFSGIRARDAGAPHRSAESRRASVVPSRGSVGASGDLAPLAHLALVLIGEGEAWHDDRRESGRRRAAPRRTRAADAGAEGRPGSHQRHATVHGAARARLASAPAPRARGRHHGRAEHRRPAGLDASVRSPHSRRAGYDRPGGLRRKPQESDGRERHQRRACQLRAGAGRLLDALRAAGARRGA